MHQKYCTSLGNSFNVLESKLDETCPFLPEFKTRQGPNTDKDIMDTFAIQPTVIDDGDRLLAVFKFVMGTSSSFSSSSSFSLS